MPAKEAGGKDSVTDEMTSVISRGNLSLENGSSP
jgi:hypothetical protein